MTSACNNVTVVGLQWGDEGKGKIVDALASRCQYVARYCGGANAGHTVTVEGQRFALHLIPSGILHAGVHNVIGNGVVFDPPTALDEMAKLRERGVKVGPENLHISSAASIVMPYHKLQDRLSEAALGSGKIGTTARGIGPCYADKAARTTSLRMADLLDPAVLRQKLSFIIPYKNKVLGALYAAEPLDLEAVFTEFAEYGRQLAPMVCDTGALLRKATAEGRSVCFEGGQGSMLDIDHGTFPFVTSCAVTAAGVPSGAGVPPKAVGTVIGVMKSYTSRVGAGPFPTEQNNPIGDAIRTRGREFGTTTGRPRRIGWFDAVAVRYAAELSGADEVALMLLMDGPGEVATWRICTAYRYAGKTYTQFDPGLPLDKVECVYEDWPTWTAPIAAARTFSQLPAEAQRYVARLEELVGRPIGLISVGAGREQTICKTQRWQGLM